MSYGHPSAYPLVPNSTPQLPTRPPIHNPYDKFTQPQFDEWIGDITGALRKALGQEEEAPTSQAAQTREEDAHTVSDTDEDNVEDSFAEWKAIRAKEKGKMRATEEKQGSEYGGSQESCEASDVQDHAAGKALGDAIELLSDEDTAERGEVDVPGERNYEDSDGGLIEDLSPVESDEEEQQPHVGSSQPAIPPKMHNFADTTGQEAIEISDGETEDRDQGDSSLDTEGGLFGWEEEGQPPEIREPWELPRTYAEDLYTGGPIRETDRSKLSPSHLTPDTEKADYFDNIDPQLRPSSILVSQPANHSLAEVSQGPAITTLIPPTKDEIPTGDDEISLYDEDTLEPDSPATVTLRDEPDFISFAALNQPSDMESEQGEPETLYISDNDGGEVSEADGEAEEDELDDGDPIPLGTSDLEIPAEHELEEDGREELDELEDDDEPVTEVTINPPYGYYGLDASSVTGSGGLDDETGIAGPFPDHQKGDQGDIPGVAISQESTSRPESYNLVPLPAASTFIEIDQLRSTASAVGGVTKVALAEAPLALSGGIPITSAEIVAGTEDTDSIDEASVGDDTILVEEAVLTVNEVEEVLRGAFAQADQLITDAQEGTIPTSNATPYVEECTPSKSGTRGTTPEVLAGEGPLPNESAPKEDEHPTIKLSLSIENKLPNSKEAQKELLPFIMPLVANPNVRDPMSAPRSPVQSGPSTPVAGLAYLPAVAKFKRDNQPPGTSHTGSGLFTPLEGSGSSSPSHSDTAIPEGAGAGVETDVPVVTNDKQLKEEQTTSMLTSSMIGSPVILEVGPEAVPTGPPEDDDWGEIPRLPTPPAEIADHVEGTLPTGPVTRVFFQPEPSSNIDGLDEQTEADRDDDTQGSDSLPVVATDVPHEENEDVPGSDDLRPLPHTTEDTAKDLLEDTETEDPLKLTWNDGTTAPDAVTDDSDDSSIASCSIDEETPRLKASEISISGAEDSRTAETIRPDIQPSLQSLTQAQGDTIIPTETQENLRKRKRSLSIPVDPELCGPGSAARDKVSDMVTASIRNEDHEDRGLADSEPQKNGEGHDSDNESFASSLIAPRSDNPPSQEASRSPSVAPEQPLLLQGQTPVPEDAPVFHGHGKFKAALQALKLLRRTSEQTRAEERERDAERPKEKKRSIASKTGFGEPSESGSKGSGETKQPPSLILPEVSTQPSLPSASTSQSPRTPTSALPPSSPTVVTAPAEITPSPHQSQMTREPPEPDREDIRKPAVKSVKRTTSRKHVPVEPKSTRSQCRYRKISLPREENGPRVTFCVPQCSLNNKELMEEEDITDDGVATVRDFERLWDHVEEQNLNHYLIGVIRQLVGLDLLRENEIYYLPTDEEIKRVERRQKREERRKSRKHIGGTPSEEGAGLFGRSDSVSATTRASQPSLSQPEKGKFGPPSSFAESISTTASTRSKIGRGGSARSISEDEISDGEFGGRASKRRRMDKERGRDGSSRRNAPGVREDSAGLSTAGSPAPSQSTTERTPARRSQRTLKRATDAQAYKPPVSGDDESSEDGLVNTKARRRSARGGAKGLKRRRTEGTADSLVPFTAGGTGDRDAPLSPRSTRSKRAKIDEK